MFDQAYSISYEPDTTKTCQGLITSLEAEVFYTKCGHMATHMVRDGDDEFFSCMLCGLSYIAETPMATLRALQQEPIEDAEAEDMAKLERGESLE